MKAPSIEKLKDIQLVTMSKFEQTNSNSRTQTTPERINRHVKLRQKHEDETIKVLKAQLSQNNSKELLKKVPIQNGNSKISITFDDRGAQVSKQVSSTGHKMVLNSNTYLKGTLHGSEEMSEDPAKDGT
jgi:hypothetical protein